MMTDRLPIIWSQGNEDPNTLIGRCPIDKGGVLAIWEKKLVDGKLTLPRIADPAFGWYNILDPDQIWRRKKNSREVRGRTLAKQARQQAPARFGQHIQCWHCGWTIRLAIPSKDLI